MRKIAATFLLKEPPGNLIRPSSNQTEIGFSENHAGSAAGPGRTPRAHGILERAPPGPGQPATRCADIFPPGFRPGRPAAADPPSGGPGGRQGAETNSRSGAGQGARRAGAPPAAAAIQSPKLK